MPSQFIDWAALAAAVIAFAALWHLKRTRTAGFGLRVIIATVLGIALGLWRILRCNPFGKCGRDPVPPRGKWHN